MVTQFPDFYGECRSRATPALITHPIIALVKAIEDIPCFLIPALLFQNGGGGAEILGRPGEVLDLALEATSVLVGLDA